MALKTQNMEMADPKKVLVDMLKTFSGSGVSRDIKFNMFYRIYAFKGVVPGIGCSTIVANTALALADLGLSVCVFDTSMLHPVQDELLHTDYRAKAIEQRLDWFDMLFSKESPLSISSLNRMISVLSFAGKGRTMLDMISTMDSEELVDIAVDEIESKFDIILVDLCDEPTNVNVTAMQRAQQVLQVWSDSITALASMQTSIANNVTLSCPYDKMRYVIENKTCDDTMGSLDALYDEYHFIRLSHCSLSYEIARISGLGHQLWKCLNVDGAVEDFNLLIIDVVVHILGLEKKALHNGEVKPRRSVESILQRNEENSGSPLSLSMLKRKTGTGATIKIPRNTGEEEESTPVKASASVEESEDLFASNEAVGVEPAPKKGLFGRRKNK